AFRGTLDQQASFVIEDLALALASGTARVEIYKMRDGAAEGNGELYGLVRNDGSTRPAYRAYAVAATYVAGATSALYTWHADESAPSPAEIDALLASDAQRYQFVWPAAVNMVILQRPGHPVPVALHAGPPRPLSRRLRPPRPHRSRHRSQRPRRLHSRRRSPSARRPRPRTLATLPPRVIPSAAPSWPSTTPRAARPWWAGRSRSRGAWARRPTRSSSGSSCAAPAGVLDPRPMAA